MSTKADQREWRRTKVIELRARGMTHGEIAWVTSIEDNNYFWHCIPARAGQGTIKEYVTQHLPEQYQVCLSVLDTILKHAFEILQNVYDNREKLQAMELFKDKHLVKLELLSNATTIDSALSYIKNKQHQQRG